MKNINTILSVTLFISFFLYLSPIFASGSDGEIIKQKMTILPHNPGKVQMAQKAMPQFDPVTSFRGSSAYGVNLWTYQFFTFDVDFPTEITIIGDVEYIALCGDFAPGDPNNMWIIEYPDNTLKTVDIATGLATFVTDIPCPLPDGLWTSLSIHKSTGQFYAIATDETQSKLYGFDPATGAILSELALGLVAVISSSFDASGTLYIFDIDTDNTYAVDVTAGTVTELGPAGFDGNYAQGMGYDPAGDVVYLAAYEDLVGPQLRQLDRITGQTTLVAGLPGETAAFGFPIEFAGPTVNAGMDATTCENQSYFLTEATASNYTTLEWATTGDGSYDDAMLLNPTYLPGPQDMATGEVDLCLTATGNDGATQVTDCMKLSVQGIPEANAGGNFTIVAGDDFPISSATAQNYQIIQWSSSGDGTFNDPAMLNPVYSPGDNDKEVGEVELCLVASPINPCTLSATSCMTLFIFPLPSGLDFGDAPETGVPILTFPTTLSQNGAVHTIIPDIYLGNRIDGEPDGQPSANADGDDTDLFYPSMGDDEDGVILPASVFAGTIVTISVKASVSGYLDAWMDFDLDHTWFHPAEHIFIVQPLLSGNNTLSFTVPATAVTGQSFLRFRFRDYPMPLSFDGQANNGEVEDYTVEIKANNIEGWDFGDAPQNGDEFNYPTLLSDEGARHFFVPGIHLGAIVDVEPDGQPTLPADGDDTDKYYPSLGDDEEGVTFSSQLITGSLATLTVRAGVYGYLDAWLDYDGDGDWQEAAEHIFSTQALVAGVNNLSFTIPGTAQPGMTYARFRFRDYEQPLDYKGPAENGEVEDYRVEILDNTQPLMDFGDAPEEGLPFLLSYPTTIARNGAAHIIDPLVYLGGFVDVEPDGQPNANADGDDTDMLYPSLGDDEDGVILPDTVAPGSVIEIVVTASVDGFLDTWMDFNLDHTWYSPDEHVFTTQPVTAGTNSLSFTVPATAVSGKSYLRFRFRSDDTSLSFDGIAGNGEVEDYFIMIGEGQATGFDFGDAPDGLYPTLLTSNGAHHAYDGFTFLGNTIDIEADGFQSVNAKGDDLNNLDDEDGIQFLNPMLKGGTATLQAMASTGGYLNVWIDFDKNGSWSDAGEQVISGQWLNAGSNTLSFAIPLSASSGNTFMRFRFSSVAGLDFTGFAPNGEVEDYMVRIYPDWTFVPTFITHIIQVPSGLPPLQSGDMLGVFYMDDDGIEQCGGTLFYFEGQPNQMLAYGDDMLTLDIKEGFTPGEMIRWKLFAIGSESVFDLDVIYNTGYPNHDGTFVQNGFSSLSEISYPQNICELPAGWDHAVTGQLHLINIPLSANPEIFGVPLDAGDWIGVFYLDENGGEACGGAVQWNGISGVVMKAYGDDPFTTEKDGFDTGEKLRWRLFDCDGMENFTAGASYNPEMPCEGYFGDFCLSEIVSLQAMYFQQFSMVAGWNSISSYLIPADPEIESILSSVENDLVIIRNLTSVYWPYAGINTIGNWNNNTGYALKLTGDVDLEIGGSEFAYQTIELSAGWHYLPVLSSCGVDPMELFGPVMDKITIVQDLIGTKVWWPDLNIFTLDVLEPGKAYKIRTTDDIELHFPDCGFKSGIGSFQNKNHQSTPWGNLTMTPSSHTVSIMAGAIGGMDPGDAIGAFDEQGNLCGFLEIENTHRNQVMVLFGNDVTTETKGGFSENEPIEFRLMKKATEEESILGVTFDFAMPNAEQVFNNLGLSSITKITLTGFQTLSELDPDIRIYPNPSSGMININGIEENASIKIFNAFGVEVKQIEMLTSGEINLSGQSKGVYFIRIENERGSYFEKVILN
nr:T9SS type A sorting domain-containing protein [Bacteroidota bacterium]